MSRLINFIDVDILKAIISLYGKLVFKRCIVN